MKGELSFDLVKEDDIGFVEGDYGPDGIDSIAVSREPA